MSGNKRNESDVWGDAALLAGVAAVAGGLAYFLTRSSDEKEPGQSNRSRLQKFAIDCEMVGAPNGRSQLASVSVVDENYRIIYSEVVRPTEPVTDYRTPIHGMTPDQIQNGRRFDLVQDEVLNIISGNIIIGHSVSWDLAVLKLSHPEHLIRDVATYPPFQKYNRGYKPSLKDLAWHVLGERIQTGYHTSDEDALTCMKLYKKVESDWN